MIWKNAIRGTSIAIVFVIATAIMTYPVIFRLGTFIPGFGNTDEPYGVIWDMWWYRYSGKTPLSDYARCGLLAHPFGVDLGNIAGATYFWEGIKHALLSLANEVVTYNLLVLSSFLFALFTTYLLVYYLTRSMPASLFSALVFSFSPYHFARSWQHLSLSQIQWLPVFIFSLFGLTGHRKKGATLFTALSFFLVASFNFYYAYFSLVAAIVFLVFFLAWNKKIHLGLQLTGKLGIAFVVAALFLLPAFHDIYKRQAEYKDARLEHNLIQRPFDDLFTQAAKPLSFLLPATAHPVFGKFTERFIGSPLYGVSYTEHSLYLGWTPLLLAFAAYRIWRKRRRDSDFYIGFFVWLAIAAWLFSQPPYFTFPYFKIYMPSFFMYKPLPMFRAYARFGIAVMLAVSVLAGFGLKFILEKLKTQTSKLIFTSFVCGLVLFEFWNWPPYKVIDLTKYPEVYDWLKTEKGDFAIAEYPLDREGPNEYYKFCQTIHRKKIVNGTIPGTYANRVAMALGRLSEPNTPQALSWMGVKYVLVHLEAYQQSNDAEVLDELEKIKRRQVAGLEYLKGFNGVEVYRVTAEPRELRLDGK